MSNTTSSYLEDIPGNEIGKRALAIAIVGNHTIAFVPESTLLMDEYQKAQLNLYVEQFRDVAEKYNVVTLHELRKSSGNDFVSADITVNVLLPKYQESRNWREREEYFIDGTVKPKANRHKVDRTLCPTGKRLMKSAVHQMSLSEDSYNSVVEVATSIAAMANRRSVEAVFLAEALQYRVVL